MRHFIIKSRESTNGQITWLISDDVAARHSPTDSLFQRQKCRPQIMEEFSNLTVQFYGFYWQFTLLMLSMLWTRLTVINTEAFELCYDVNDTIKLCKKNKCPEC